MKIRHLLVAGWCSLLSVGALAAGHKPASSGNARKNDINGGVYHSNSQKPLTNVQVTAYRISKKEGIAHTDTNGYYALDDLKPGVYKFVFEKTGYRKVIKDNVPVKPDNGYQMNVKMNEESDFIFMPGVIEF